MKKQSLVLMSIVLLGFFFRSFDVNWDSNFHLHPDERFLTMVGNAMKLPSSFSEYLTSSVSPFNPNNVGFSFYVYGVFPVTLNKLIAILLRNNTYNNFTLQGRFLSALIDTFTIVILYKIIQLLELKGKFNPFVKYIGAFLYAISVLPIQLSHFFTVDIFLNFFILSSFYFTLRFYLNSKIKFLVLSSVLFGLALSSKISAVYILPLNVFFTSIPFLKLKKNITAVVFLLIYVLCAYLTVRLFDPYLFEYPNFLNVTVSNHYLQNISTLKSFDNPNVWFPPSIQWVHKPPILFSLSNLIFFGIGIPYFILFLTGIFIIAFKKNWELRILLLWVLLFFFYQSTQYVKIMRYFIFLYPFLAFFAALPLSLLFKNSKKIFTVCVFFILIWPLSFLSIYVHKHSRVLASEWIYSSIPSDTILTAEHWDDPLPLSLNSYKQYKIKTIPIFDSDTQEKWKIINNTLSEADYIVLSSNRGWGSLPTVPEKYPLTTKFYKNLFSQKLSFKKIAEFTSYPSLEYLGIPLTFPDDWADESFTVYDHPKVLIFKKESLL